MKRHFKIYRLMTSAAACIDEGIAACGNKGGPFGDTTWLQLFGNPEAVTCLHCKKTQAHIEAMVLVKLKRK
jgi:hypothetical protein